jgi:hypothetical protein
MVATRGRARSAWGTAFAVALVVLAWGSPAAAQAPAPPSITDQIHITLDFHGVPECSQGKVFQQALRSRVYRWDVWARPAPWRLALTIVPKDGAYQGEAVLWDPEGTDRWGRRVEGPRSCIDLLEDVAHALALVIDPPRPPTPAEPPAAPSPQELPPPVPAPPLPPSKPPVVFQIGASARGDYATVRRLEPGFAVSGGVHYRWFSVAFEAGWEAPGALPLTGGAKGNIARLTAGVVLCGHVQWFVSCVIGQASEIQFLATATPTAVILRGAGGVRVGAKVPILPGRLFFTLSGDAFYASGPALVDRAVLIGLPQLNVGVGLGLLVEIKSP